MNENILMEPTHQLVQKEFARAKENTRVFLPTGKLFLSDHFTQHKEQFLTIYSHGMVLFFPSAKYNAHFTTQNL